MYKIWRSNIISIVTDLIRKYKTKKKEKKILLVKISLQKKCFSLDTHMISFLICVYLMEINDVWIAYNRFYYLVLAEREREKERKFTMDKLYK